MRYLALVFFSLIFAQCSVSQNALSSSLSIDQAALEIDQEVIDLRRHFHEFPELSNREFKTAERIAEELVKMGLKPETGIAKTGVVAVLETGRPGPTIGLRADIDGLPVAERVKLDFASKQTTEFLGKDVGIMHACGHDTHVAMLLGAAKILVSKKEELKGKIVFVFQPAEEGPPPGEEGGAKLMVKEGMLEKYGIEVMFGQHISSGLEVGKITYKLGGAMAAADRFEIKVKGKQTHGSRPWGGVDPIVTSAQIIIGLQTIISRQTELTKEAAVISVGKMEAGVRNNIIPEEAIMIGTIRTLDMEMQKIIHDKIRKTARLIAESQGAEVEVTITNGAPVTFNDPTLSKSMIPSLYKAAGEDKVLVVKASTGAEDFAYFANEIPSFYWFVGGMAKGTDIFNAPPHHTPDFYIDELGLKTGVKAMVNVAMDYLSNQP